MKNKEKGEKHLGMRGTCSNSSQVNHIEIKITPLSVSPYSGGCCRTAMKLHFARLHWKTLDGLLLP